MKQLGFRKSLLITMHRLLNQRRRRVQAGSPISSIKDLVSLATRTQQENKKMINDVDSYSLIDKSYNELNNTVDMIIQNSIKTNKSDISYYGNAADKSILKSGLQEKQKPAAPEIKKKAINQIGNINICLSDPNMPKFSNVKSFKRPKSMERLKRKPTNKNKNSKSKMKKTKRKNKIKEEFTTFDHTGVLNISHNSGTVSKSLWRDTRFKDKFKNTTAHECKTTKFDKEISKIWKIKSGNVKDSRNAKLDKSDIHNTYSMQNKIKTETVSAFGRKGSSISQK